MVFIINKEKLVNIKTGYRGEYEGLPPRDVRLWSKREHDKLETPLDEFGRVSLDALIAVVKSTVTSDYDWQSEFDDIHHLQWPATSYAGINTLASRFRELTSFKAYLPRRLHNWTHAVTLKPPVPTIEVMQLSVDAHETMQRLALIARHALRLTRTPGVPEERLKARLEEKLDNYQYSIEEADKVPAEFRLLPLHDIHASTVDELLLVNRRFGRKSILQIPLRTRSSLPKAS